MRTTVLAAALAVAAFTGTQAQAATYNIDPTHTFVTFEVTHFGTSTNRGRFDKKEGVVQFDRAAKTGSVKLTIQADSINTGTEAFNAHLKKPDFFDAAKHPTMSFSADKFSFNGDKVSEVAGSLTMLGKTLPVVLKATNFNCYDGEYPEPDFVHTECADNRQYDRQHDQHDGYRIDDAAQQNHYDQICNQETPCTQPHFGDA